VCSPPVDEGEITLTEDWARPVVHWEIQAQDPDALRAFYARLFNWQIGDGPLMRIPPGVGGPEPGPAGHIRQGDHPGVTLYIQVRDLRASLTKAEQLGGRILAQPRDLPEGPTIAGIADPEGNRVVLVQQ
jgi:predicted enzyme related to lactoylglutathione lyase